MTTTPNLTPEQIVIDAYDEMGNLDLSDLRAQMADVAVAALRAAGLLSGVAPLEPSECSNPECPLWRAHSGPCAPKGWNPDREKLIAEEVEKAARWMAYDDENPWEALTDTMKDGYLKYAESAIRAGLYALAAQPVKLDPEKVAALLAEHEEVYDENLGRLACSCGDDYTEGLMDEHRARALCEAFEKGELT